MEAWLGAGAGFIPISSKLHFHARALARARLHSTDNVDQLEVHLGKPFELAVLDQLQHLLGVEIVFGQPFGQKNVDSWLPLGAVHFVVKEHCLETLTRTVHKQTPVICYPYSVVNGVANSRFQGNREFQNHCFPSVEGYNSMTASCP